jgi:protoheme IX farnesyltransferase
MKTQSAKLYRVVVGGFAGSALLTMSGIFGYPAGFATVLFAVAAILLARVVYPDKKSFTFLAALGTASAVCHLLLYGLAPSHSLVNGLQLLIASITLGIGTILTTLSFLPSEFGNQRTPVEIMGSDYLRTIFFTGMGLLLLFITGSFVSGTNSGSACPDWPLCWGEIFPYNFTLNIAIILVHRFTVVLIGVLVAAVILQTRRNYSNHKTLKSWSTALGILFLIQMVFGGLYSIEAVPNELISLTHHLLTAATWISLITLGTIAFYVVKAEELPVPQPATSMTARQRALTYFKLTKPWVLLLLLLTTITAMFIAARGLPSISLILYTLLGGMLSAGGASVLNSYIDSDIDQVMARTSRRGTVTGLVTPRETLILGLTLSALSFIIYAVFVNTISAILSTVGIIYYVFFYTLYLKRTTIHNIIIGGAAGAIPPLVGWTAVTNTLDLGALYLFAIIFFWTPPHTWALAMMVKKDYSKAGVPMLPVIVGEKETSYQILLYTILLIPLTLLPFTFNMVSWFYLVVAILLGTRFLILAWKLWQDHANKSLCRQLYKYSQSYLALLFLIMAIDRTLF